MLGTENVTRKMTTHKLPDGREIVLCSFGLYEWSAVQEAALSHYKRSVIKTWAENADLLPPEMRQDEIRRVYREAEQLTIRDLPKRLMRMPQLDADGNEVRDAAGNLMMADAEVDYTSWWMSDTMDGTLHCAWLSARKAPGQESWTKQHLSDLFAVAGEAAAAEIDQAATAVARISRSEMAKNSSPPPPDAAVTEGMMTPKQIRMAKRQERMQRATGVVPTGP